MFKTISAALVAVAIVAAPALAGDPGKTTEGPVNKTVHAPVIKAEPVKTKVLNANARMGRHHHRHFRHHRHHKHIGLLKTHDAPQLAVRRVTAPKRG